MKKYFIVPLMLIVIASLVGAPSAQADLVSLTLILSGVFFTGVAVNESINHDANDSADDLSTKTNLSP